MAKQAKTKEASKADAPKFWAVTGYQKQDMEIVRYVQASSAEEAVEEATFGEVIREDTPRGVDWGEWGADNIPEDAEEVTEAEAKGTERDGSEEDARSVDPLWETIAPTLEQPGGPGYLLGHIDLLGVRHHVEFVRAKWDRDNLRWVAYAKDDGDNDARLFELQDGKEGVWPRNVKLPGRKGSWLFVVSAYAD